MLNEMTNVNRKGLQFLFKFFSPSLKSRISTLLYKWLAICTQTKALMNFDEALKG